MDPTEQLEAIHRIAKQQVAERLRAIIGLAEQKAINSVPKVDLNFPEKFKPLGTFLDSASRYAIFFGGRGSAKSWSVHRWALVEGTKRKMRIMCAREYQRSIADSVHTLLSDQIKELGLEAFYTVRESYIEGANGTLFFFVGLWNARSIKSTEGVDIVIVEEAEKVSESSWRFLLPTIRKKGSKVIVIFNPALEDDPTYVRFVKSPPPGSLVIPVSWRDNPHFTEELRFEMENDRQRDHDAYLHVWEGQCLTNSEAQILSGKWEVREFEDPEGVHPMYGLDFGFSVDPNAGVRCFIKDESLWITHEHYKHKEEIDHLPAGIIADLPGVLDYLLQCDLSAPEQISFLTRHGVPRAVGAEKWPDSVIDGIRILRGFKKIFIHPRCVKTITEARLWSYKIDPHTDQVKAEVKSGHDHIWDAVRYALVTIIRRSTAKDGMLEFYRRMAEEAQAKREAGPQA